MSLIEIKHCPGTLSEGFGTYSGTALRRVFGGKKVHYVLPYVSPACSPESYALFDENRKCISISGVQEKFSMLMVKNKFRLTKEGEQGTYILKPIPRGGRMPDQMPANEHLTMQIARQVYNIETAANALIFFRQGLPAYITKRFDVKDDGVKLAQDDFATLAKRTPQTHGEHYKYLGNYLEVFDLMREYLPAYKLEAPKLLKQLIFNFLFSNGEAHLKSFSILETANGDYRLSPAYDLLNSRIHLDDKDFALDDGLLPRHLAHGNLNVQFATLAEKAGISSIVFDVTMASMLAKTYFVEQLVAASFLNDITKRHYLNAYLERLKQLQRP